MPTSEASKREDYLIRPIEARDNDAVARVIRTVMPEFGAGGEGFAIHDAEVDAMHAAYAGPLAAYYVVEMAGEVVGGAGVAPLEGGPGDTCELRKMYFLKSLRGRGAGHALMRRCLETARAMGYRQCYIETLDGMDGAMALYLKSGFRRIDGPLGATGHFSCDRFYLRPLQADEEA